MARDRGLDLANHNHLPDILNETSFNWKRFVAREMITRYAERHFIVFVFTDAVVFRTVTNIFFLDASFTIFTNLPPRMLVSEMDVDVICPEPCFQASTAEECLEQLKLWRQSFLGGKPCTLSKAVSMLCRGKLSHDLMNAFVQTNVTNMLAFILCKSLLSRYSDIGFLTQVQLYIQ